MQGRRMWAHASVAPGLEDPPAKDKASDRSLQQIGQHSDSVCQAYVGRQFKIGTEQACLLA